MYGSREFLQTANYVQIIGFNNQSYTVQLGNVQSQNNTYFKSATVTMTPNWSDSDSVSSATINMYVKTSNDSSDWVLQSTYYFNLVYPIFSGFVEKDVWDAGNHIGSYADETVIKRGVSQIQQNGYEIINTVFECRLTTSQYNDNSTDRYYI